MRARRLTRSDLAAFSPDDLTGAVLLAPVALAGSPLRKGTRLDPPIIERLIAAARSGELADSVRIAWLESGDLHEDEAALRLARAAAGPGLDLHPPRQSRLDLVARWDGVVHVRMDDLRRLNSPDALELFTVYHGQAVAAGDMVASVKVAPHVVRVVLVGGVSAGDPLSPFFAALEGLGGHILRRGVPAHPGSMIWLAELDGSRLLGLPQCGMFTMATAADLILPRLLTGEPLTGADLADLAHGGILSRDMRFRMPAYARDLIAPEG